MHTPLSVVDSRPGACFGASSAAGPQGKAPVWRAILLAGLAVAAMAPPAHAAVEASLRYTTPHATVLPTEVIELWVTLSLSPTSDTLLVDRASEPPVVSAPGVLPDFESIISVHPGTSVTCTGTFIQGCDNTEGPYFLETYSTTWFEIGYPQPLVLHAGESLDVRLGSFIPNAGRAPLGDYVFYSGGLSLQVRGVDAGGQAHWATVEWDVCPTATPDCSFTRSVVPEPSATGLALAALAGLWLTRSRRGLLARRFRPRP